MNVLIAQGQETEQTASRLPRKLWSGFASRWRKRVFRRIRRTAVRVQGGGCSGLSYNIRFDTQPRERDRVYSFGEGTQTAGDPTNGAPIRIFVDPKSFIYAWYGAGLRRDADASGVQLHQSEFDQELRLWVELFGIALVPKEADCAALACRDCERRDPCSVLDSPRMKL